MYDGASLSDPVRLQRAVGELRVTARRRDGETVLDDLRQAGCLKARFPHRVVPGWMDIVMLNTGGGVAGGDRLDLSFNLAPGAQAVLAAQAAERFYRATDADAPSHVRTVLSVAEGAALEWLPQETILFDRFALDRRLEVEMAPTGCFLGVETLVFGRTAMGETVRQGKLRDLIRVRRGGELVLHDAIRMDGDFAATMLDAAIGQGAHVLATIIYLAPDAEALLESVRRALDGCGGLSASRPVVVGEGPRSAPLSSQTSAYIEAAASAWNGMLVARVLGHDSRFVRAAVAAALGPLRNARPLPRVWLC